MKGFVEFDKIYRMRGLRSHSMNHQINLNELLTRHPNLEVVSSKSLYPNSKGTGLDLLKVSTPLFEAHISFQGAQLLYFKPRDGSSFLWLSPNCDFTPGIALRGGIPLCLPWFGPHPTDSTKPKHGFVRNREWQLTDALLLENNGFQIRFKYFHLPDSLFALPFDLEVIFTLSDQIDLELIIHSPSETPMECSFAFHSYHPVENLSKAQVRGLEQKPYLDNLENHAVKIQSDVLNFPQEVDRVFQNIAHRLELMGKPHLAIDQKNCASVIVWNCGSQNAEKISDIGKDNEQHYVCVERGNVLDQRWLLKSEKQSAKIRIIEIG